MEEQKKYGILVYKILKLKKGNGKFILPNGRPSRVEQISVSSINISFHVYLGRHTQFSINFHPDEDLNKIGKCIAPILNFDCDFIKGLQSLPKEVGLVLPYNATASNGLIGSGLVNRNPKLILEGK